MAKNDIFMYALLGVGFLVFYYKFDGKSMINNLINEVKGGLSSGGGGGGGDLPTVEGINGQVQSLLDKAKSRTGSWTDSKGNSFNNQSDTNTESNIGKSGSIVQKQSNVFYTIPRFGNL